MFVGKRKGIRMAQWKLHVPDATNRITHYRCGLVAGQRVRLRKEWILNTHEGNPSSELHPAGEEWVVLAGVESDPVLWFLQPNGERCTCNDDAAFVHEWFER